MDDLQKYTQTPLSVRDLLQFAISRFEQSDLFYGHGTDNATDEATALVSTALSLPFDVSVEMLDELIDAETLIQVMALIEQRAEQNTPLPYLFKQAWYGGYSFYVDERVLIPRSPIFEIIQSKFKPWYQGESPKRILDLCTGSGCIGIACAYQFDSANIVLADLSKDALDVAAINIAQHALTARVVTQQSDLLDDVSGKFDLIVSNPPYVDAEDFSAMPSEFKHEPGMALASGKLGLDHPLKILRHAVSYLTDDGLLVLELGNSGMHLENLYPDIDFNWVEFEYGGFGVLAISKIELEMYAEQLALSPDYSDFDQ